MNVAGSDVLRVGKASSTDGPPGAELRAPLAVDLDGTLIASDLLMDSFAHGLANSPFKTLLALPLARGRADLKQRLARIAPPDPATLPYRDDVLETIRAAKREGRQVVLVSAADASLVRAVADHLGVFDEAHGSTPERNLKGTAKADFLTERFGHRGFDYLGDSRADLSVWPAARHAISVAAGPRLRADLDDTHAQASHIAPAPGGAAAFLPYLRAMRPKHWTKNLLLGLPVLAAHSTDLASWGDAVLAFLAFCLTASSLYLINDVLDLGPDRAHPRKRQRPLANGDAGIGTALVLALALAAVAAAVAAMLPAGFGMLLLLYAGLTMAYSLALKRLLMIDVVVLAGLFTLRILAGGAASETAISQWMLGFCGFLFFALASVKRLGELADARVANRSEVAGRAWRPEDLPVVTMMAVGAAHAAVLVFALYVSGADVQALYLRPQVLWLACPVLLFWLLRLVLLANRGAVPDDPLAFAMADRTSLIAAASLGVIGLAAAPV